MRDADLTDEPIEPIDGSDLAIFLAVCF